MTLIADISPKFRTPKNLVTYMSKRSCLRGPFDKQHDKQAQTLSQSKNSTITIFSDPFEGN